MRHLDRRQIGIQPLPALKDFGKFACTLAEHVRNCDIYDQIAGHSS